MLDEPVPEDFLVAPLGFEDHELAIDLEEGDVVTAVGFREEVDGIPDGVRERVEAPLYSADETHLILNPSITFERGDSGSPLFYRRCVEGGERPVCRDVIVGIAQNSGAQRTEYARVAEYAEWIYSQIAAEELDVDTDGDEVADRHDNCWLEANPDQYDRERDGVGDACDVCVDVGETAYLFGGRTAEGSFTDALYRLDLRLLHLERIDGQSSLTPGPRERASLSAAPEDEALYLFVDLEALVEFRLDACESYWCNFPTVFQNKIVFMTAPHGLDDVVQTIWTYRVGDDYRFPLATRRMTERSLSMREFDLNGDIMVDLGTGLEQQVTDLPGPERHPRSWGHRLFFVAEDLTGEDAIFMVDLVEAGLIEPR